MYPGRRDNLQANCAVPYGFKRLQIRYRRRFLSIFAVVGAVIDRPFALILNRFRRATNGRPYGFKRLQIRYRRRILIGFAVVGAGALDSP